MTRRPPPANPKMRAALQELDTAERAKETCGNCGKPIRGVLFHDAATGRTQTWAEAGLCECPPVTQICARCKTVIEQGRPGAPLSHGLCKECQKRDFPQAAA